MKPDETFGTNGPETPRDKLWPGRYSHMSGIRAAILGCIMGEAWSTPSLAELCITSDGMLLGRRVDDCGFNEFIGAADDLDDNLGRLLDVAAITEEERGELFRRYQAVKTDHR